VSGDAARIVLVTAPDSATAERLAKAAVEERLAACGNVVPGLTSIYRWEGAVQRDAEVLLVLKTTARCTDALIRRVTELHPYEVPEALALEVEGGYAPYLAWIAGSTAGAEV
jgi:periplasmic divalent cation tolerance protein